MKDPEKMLSLITQLSKQVMELRTGRAPFHLYRRKTSKMNGKKPVYIFYAQFFDPVTEKYLSGKSTKQTSKAAATTWCLLQLKKATRAAEDGEPITALPPALTQKKALTLKEFASGFFDPGSAFMTHRRERGRPMSENHRRHNAVYLTKYIFPFFRDKPLKEITDLDIEDFQSWMLIQPARVRNGKPVDHNTLSGATANHVTQSLRHVIKWAIKRKLIAADPFVGVETLVNDKQRRGTFEVEEVRTLFSLGPEAWPDPRTRILCKLSAVTGIRKGEAQTVRLRDITEIILKDGRKSGIIEINSSYDRATRTVKSTKSGTVRHVPVPPGLYAEIVELIKTSPFQAPESFLFYGSDHDKVISHFKIDKDFLRAVHALGIDEVERKKRGIVLHSLRHFSNSYLVNSGIPLLRVQQTIGHTSLKMTENYLHSGEDYSDILKITDGLFK